jgi:hypothetical protein
MRSETINYQDVLSDLLERREKLDAARLKLDAAISAIQQIVDEMPKESQIELLPMPPNTMHALGPLSGMTIIGAAIEVLRGNGSPMNTGMLARGVLSGGFRTNSKSFYRTLYNTLTSNLEKQIVRGKDGKWGLREWHEEGS